MTRVTPQMIEVRRSWSEPFRYMMDSSNFSPSHTRFGLTFDSPPMFTLKQLLMHLPANVTYVTDGSGLDTVPIEAMEEFGQPVYMKTILDSKPDVDVVVFGEDHLKSRNSHILVKSSLGELSNRGFDLYGVEHLSVDEDSFIDDFNLDKPGGDERLLDRVTGEDKGFFAYGAQSQMAIYREAREKGLEVFPLSAPITWGRMNLTPAMPFFMASSIGDDPHARSCFAALIANAYASKEHQWHKMVTLMGRGHIDVNNGFPYLMGFFGYRTLSIALVERSDVKEPFMVQYTNDVWKAVPHYQTLNYSSRDNVPREADWIVFLPRDIKETPGF